MFLLVSFLLPVFPGAFSMALNLQMIGGFAFRKKTVMFLHFKLKMEHLECGPVKHAILRILTTKWKLRMQAHPHKIVLYTWFSIYSLVLLVWCLENCSTQVIVKTHAICKVFCIFCFFFHIFGRIFFCAGCIFLFRI